MTDSELETKYVRDVYDKIAPQFNGKRMNKWSWISDFIDSLQEQSVIYDIGCGGGRNMLYKKHFFIGVDNSKSFIDICRSKSLNVILSDMTCTGLASDSANAILSIASFHHLSSEERRLEGLAEMRRLIRPGGKILLSIWSIRQQKKSKRKFTYGNNIVEWNNSGVIYKRFYYIFSIDEFTKLCDKVGLCILEHNWIYGNEVFTLTK